MNIVFVLPGKERSGGVKCTVDLANKLIGRGHTVRLLHRKEKFNVMNVSRSCYIGLLYPHSYSWTKEFEGQIDSFTELQNCTFLADEIIIAVGVWASAELFKISSLRNVKLQYLHGATPWDPGLMKRALTLPVPKIIVAGYLKPIVESFGGEVLDLIGNGVDVEQFYPAVDESLRDGVGFVYGSHEAKAPETIFEITARLKENGIGPIRSFGIERKSELLNGCEYWRYPSIDRVRTLYSRSIIWIVASKSEGFSLPILEAMACGCAVISTDCGGPSDIIRNDENGYLVSVGDVDQIIEKVKYLLGHKHIIDEFRSRSKKTVQAFNWDKSAEKMEKMIQKVQAV